MNSVDLLVGKIAALVGDKRRSIAVFSASWPIARALHLKPATIAEQLSFGLMERFPSTTILMPTFTDGFDEHGVCDLGRSCSTTGIIAERFRQCDGIRRTRSAFFSFAVYGPERDALVALRPEYAWGNASLYEWMFQNDTTIVTLGLHPTHCSFSHYAEWRNRDRLPYRFNKSFVGMLRHEGREEDWQEILFVRRRDPSPINDFTVALQSYREHGMQVDDFSGVKISSIGARAKIAVLDSFLARDALSLISNKDSYVAHANGPT